jgi:CcmD family protein
MGNLISWIASPVLNYMSLLAITSGEDFMRQTGKMYVVYGVLSIIFIGIVLFLLYLEKRIKKIENKIDNEQQ